MPNATELSQRIRGRADAESLLSIRDQGQGETYDQAFARALRAFADGVLGAPDSDRRVMDDQQAADFERHHTIKFGKYGGMAYGEVPIDYLCWLVDSTNDLRAYLRSERAKKRIEEQSP